MAGADFIPHIKLQGIYYPSLWTLPIIFQEPVKLSSPNTNKKWLSCMTFPHVTANAMSQAPDAIKCSCFSFILRLSYFAKVSTKVHNYSGDFCESSCSSSKVSGQFKFSSSLNLIHLLPMHPFSTPWNTRKPFSNVFRGGRESGHWEQIG